MKRFEKHNMISKIQPLLVGLIKTRSGSGNPSASVSKPVQVVVALKAEEMNSFCEFLNGMNAEIIRKNPTTIETRVLAERIEAIAALDYVESVRMARLPVAF